MFRRIEFIWDRDPRDGLDLGKNFPGILGLMAARSEAVVDALIYKLRGITKGHLPRNAKFYFTELGWKEVGRNIITESQKSKHRYRILSIKETSAHIVWRDKHTGYEVAIQPKKRLNSKVFLI